MKSHLSQVAEFHLAFKYRHPEPIAPDLTDDATNKLRPELIREELLELKQAIAENNRLEQLDALCDTQYVLSGAVLAWGYRSLIENSVASVKLARIHDVDRFIAKMLGLNEQMGVAASLGYQHQVWTALVCLQQDLTRLVWHLGFSEVFKDAFAEVHRSNMSKQWNEREVALHDRNSEPKLTFHLTDGCFYIAKRDDHKIIKSPSYSPADLSRFI